MDDQEYPRIMPVNESAVLVEFGDAIDYGTNAKVYALQEAIEKTRLADIVIETIPTFRSLLVEYDFTETTSLQVQESLRSIVDEVQSLPTSDVDFQVEVFEIPVAYGGDFGPDLDFVAQNAGLSTEQVIEIHSQPTYRVFMLGFAPGFPYLGGMDSRIACPRLTTPRVNVPAGAVGIAENQTGIYPNQSPGGWQIIGRSPTVLFDVNAMPPSTLLPGTNVRFKPISHSQFEELRLQDDSKA